MLGRHRELWYALAATMATTAFYLVMYRRAGSLPAASKLVGHGIGVLGFVLMLMTETLYTLRKRARSARWGSLQAWLRAHVFTGIVGSYMVLLHPAMRFNGIAAILALLTFVVAASGFVGRYIYTMVPRTLEAAEVEAVPAELGTGDLAYDGGPGRDGPGPQQKAARVARARRALATWRAIHVPLTFALFIIAFVHIAGAIYYATLLR